ncbi:hypothetical protein [Embleya sp. AB8]|uniref:hypothetical protein n=1 Tax=Embleya sp. AB8 TaxID=3156304 RepID=UPI003C74ABD2
MTEPAALAHLAAAAAERNRLDGRHPNPATTSHREQHAHRYHCRTAGAALRSAVANAHRDGVPVDTIARTTGFSPGYVRMILEREHTPMPNRRQAQPARTGRPLPTHPAAAAIAVPNGPIAHAPSVPPAHIGPIAWNTRSADPTS